MGIRAASLTDMLKKLFQTDLHFDWKGVTITIVSTVGMMIDYFHHFIPGWKGLDRTVLYFVVPMLFIVFVFREHPKDYGFQRGDWKAGLVITAGSLLVILPVLWLLVHGDSRMPKYYQPFLVPGLPLHTFLAIFGWQCLFRVSLVFGYARKFSAAV